MHQSNKDDEEKLKISSWWMTFGFDEDPSPNKVSIFNFDSRISNQGDIWDETHPGFSLHFPMVKKFENNKMVLTNGSEYMG